MSTTTIFGKDSHTLNLKNIMLRHVFFTALLAFSLCSPSVGTAQVAGLYDNRGTDFWLAFPPNVHQGSAQDSLLISITADRPTSGKITSSNNAFAEIDFSITSPDEVVTIALPYKQIEVDPSEAEQAIKKSIHVTSISDIVVYAAETATYTSEAYLALPTDVCGKEYFAMCYKNDYYIPLDGTPSSNSQLLVIATEDATTIDIQLPGTPSQNISSISRQKRLAVTLNKGEVYLVQAFVGILNQEDDITGARIVANKPVALISGHQRASVPSKGMSLVVRPSRNQLIEQLPPVNFWGRSAIVAPFAPAKILPNAANDLFRVLCSEDTSIISINGIPTDTLSSGMFLEGELTRSFFIESNKPILVCQFKKSGKFNGSTLSESDPFMLIAPSSELYFNNYRFISFNPIDNEGFKRIDRHFATVIFGRGKESDLSLDGESISRFIIDRDTVPSSVFEYANLQIDPGAHTLNSKSPVGLYVYGYGIADAYGYNGGIKLESFSSELTANFALPPSDTINIGDEYILTMRMDSLPKARAMLLMGVKDIRATLRFNASMMTPALPEHRGKIRSGLQYAVITRTADTTLVVDSIWRVKFFTALGSAVYTPIELVDLHYTLADGDTLPTISTIQNGALHFRGFFNDDKGIRLVNPTVNNLMVSVSDGGSFVEVRFANASPSSSSLVIYDVLGKKIADLSSALSTSSGSVRFETEGLSPSAYFVRLRSGERHASSQFSR